MAKAACSDHVGVAILEQRVELRAVALELGAFVEDLAEGVLHHGDLVADADLAAELLLDVGRGRQVVGMDMGLDDPLELQAVGLDVGDDLVGVIIGDAAGGVVDVHDGIDDGAASEAGVLDDIADRVGGLVEEGLDLGFDVHVDGIVRHFHLLFPCATPNGCQATRRALCSGPTAIAGTWGPEDAGDHGANGEDDHLRPPVPSAGRRHRGRSRRCPSRFRRRPSRRSGGHRGPVVGRLNSLEERALAGAEDER
jgi:hypothetical protein